MKARPGQQRACGLTDARRDEEHDGLPVRRGLQDRIERQIPEKFLA